MAATLRTTVLMPKDPGYIHIRWSRRRLGTDCWIPDISVCLQVEFSKVK